MHPLDDNLVGYLLNALDDDGRRSVEVYLRSNPEARRKLARLQELLSALAADRDDPAPPPGLARATLARVREAVPRTLPAAPPLSAAQAGARGWWRRTDVLAAAACLLLAVGIGAAWLVSAWQRSDILACQENLHQFHRALTAYSSARPDGAFPQVEDDGPRAAAGVFIPVLADARVLGDDVSVSCPARGRRPAPEPGQLRKLEELYRTDRDGYTRAVKDVAGCYAYALGYRDAAGLHGLRQGVGDLMPIMADCPPFHEAAAGGGGNSLSHGGSGQNVLTVGGSVRYCTNRDVGLEGDDIYLNRNRRVLAGLSPTDTVLAVSDAVP